VSISFRPERSQKCAVSHDCTLNTVINQCFVGRRGTHSSALVLQTFEFCRQILSQFDDTSIHLTQPLSSSSALWIDHVGCDWCPQKMTLYFFETKNAFMALLSVLILQLRLACPHWQDRVQSALSQTATIRTLPIPSLNAQFLSSKCYGLFPVTFSLKTNGKTLIVLSAHGWEFR